MKQNRPAPRPSGISKPLFATVGLLGILLSTGIRSVAVPEPAFAAGTNCVASRSGNAPYGNYFDGYETPASYEGVSAWIEVESGALCTNKPSGDANKINFFTAWSMIMPENGNQTTNKNWVQSGYLESDLNYGGGTPASCIVNFDQIYYNNLDYSTKTGNVCLTINSQHRYWQVHNLNTSPDSVDADIDGQTVDVLQSTAAWNSPPAWIAEYFGEVTYMEDDMPGTQTYPALFNGPLLVQQPSDHSFVNTPCNLSKIDDSDWNANPSTGRWATAVPAPNCDTGLGYSNNFEIYTAVP